MSAIPAKTYPVTREALVDYAAAAGDPNPIHQDDEVARAVGLPGVIAHGMFTMALAARFVDEYVGEPGHIVELSAKFTKPVVVPPEGTEVVIEGDHTDGRVRLTVTCLGEKVLGMPVAVLRD
ncbi:MAG TPA: MaoC/PaaZ C-terminal domain-containing protein [Marmoricola sp.]|nr:MaoC/PaaZ C-terminal domain-containing protein [Marmoricola sp.]